MDDSPKGPRLYDKRITGNELPIGLVTKFGGYLFDISCRDSAQETISWAVRLADMFVESQRAILDILIIEMLTHMISHNMAIQTS